MKTHKNWLLTNIAEKQFNHHLNYTVYTRLYPFYDVSFQRSIECTINEIRNLKNDLYVGLSGGADSEFVLKSFVERHVPITPVIVKCEGNEAETFYAYKACRRFNVDPVIIMADNNKLISTFEEMNGKLPMHGIMAIPQLIAAEFVARREGFIINPNHLNGDGDGKVIEGIFERNEWDDYVDVLYPGMAIEFFSYHIETIYAMTLLATKGTWQQYKSKLYQTPYRPKMRAKYHPTVVDFFDKTIADFPQSNPHFCFGNRNQVLERLSPYVIK